MSGNLHGGTVVASYPFDDSAWHTVTGVYSSSPDDTLFRYLAQVYAKNHPIMKTGEPKCDGEPDETFKDGITNGAHWYDVPGNSDHLLCHSACLKIFTWGLTASQRSLYFPPKKMKPSGVTIAHFRTRD